MTSKNVSSNNSSNINNSGLIDVLITDIGQVPPKYFMSGEVIGALSRVIMEDVVRGQPIPPGTMPVYDPDALPVYKATDKQTEKTKEQVQALWVSWAYALLFFCLSLAIIVLALCTLWRTLHA